MKEITISDGVVTYRVKMKGEAFDIVNRMFRPKPCIGCAILNNKKEVGDEPNQKARRILSETVEN